MTNKGGGGVNDITPCAGHMSFRGGGFSGKGYFCGVGGFGVHMRKGEGVFSERDRAVFSLGISELVLLSSV